MAREYPRFLFSNPKNTKSKGPFIVHCLHPRFIAKVSFKKSNVFPAEVEILEVWDDVAPELYIVMKGQAETWLKSQIVSKEIVMKGQAETWLKSQIVSKEIKLTNYLPKDDQHEFVYVSEKKVEGECCCDPKYNFRVYDREGKVHCVHCRFPLLRK